MASGLFALLDDVAAIAKLAAASVDDIGAAAGKAGAKAAGVVIDDTAVTPRYVTGLSPQRELPIIGKIALGSLVNKLLLLLPGALLLSAFAPWAITPLLMLGGAYLCFEGAEKLMEMFGDHHAEEASAEPADAAHLEASTVKGAVRTDLILSAEIMAIALADVSASPIVTQAIVLALVGVAITIGVYGVVALIVKMDDIGLHMAGKRSRGSQAIGSALVKGMPVVLSGLSTIGTLAMLWVGGGILIHGLHEFHIAWPEEPIEHLEHWLAEMIPAIGGAVAWLARAVISGVLGLVLGGLIAATAHQAAKLRRKG